MTSAEQAASCFRAETPAPGAVIADLDISSCTTPRAAASRLQHAMTLLSSTLLGNARVRRVVAVVWTGDRGASDRERSCAIRHAEAVHRRSEMIRGTPLGLLVVFADAAAPLAELRRQLRDGVRSVPDGVAALTWQDARAQGLRAGAALTRI